MEIFGENLVLLEKVAAGGMGEIFLAKMLGKGNFEKSVAVKRIHPRIASDAEFQQLFEKEVQLSALLHHPNIIQAFGNGEIDGYLYLIMEFIDGCTLHRLFRKLHEKNEKIPADLVLLAFEQACEGLSYAHTLKDENTGNSFNLIHRDLSPDNIMLSYQGVVKIVDFGVVKTENSNHTKTGTLKGKIAYMSPEQAVGETLDCRSDIFSFCSIFYEALAGERLITAQKSEYALLQSVVNLTLPNFKEKIPHIPAEVLSLLEKGLSRNRQDRYNSCEEILKELRAILRKHFPDSDRQKLSAYLQQEFAEEIKDKKLNRELNRQEQERFVHSARMQLESKLHSQAKIIESIGEEPDFNSATRVSQISPSPQKTITSSVVKAAEKPLPGVGGSKLIAVLGVMAVFLGIACGVLIWQEFKTPSRDVATTSTTAEKAPVKVIEKAENFLPNIRESNHYGEVVKFGERGLSVQTLSALSEKWHFWDAPTAPPLGWQLTNFNDAEWKSGEAPLGYGDPVHTTISFGSDPNHKIPSAYFRREFNVDESTRLDPTLLLGIRRDDAAVVYLNGQKIYSDSFLKEPPDFNTFSTDLRAADAGEEKFQYRTFPKDVLQSGRNTLAVEVHQANWGSSDLVFEMIIVGWHP